MKAKALKYIGNKSVPLMWISILIILEFDNDSAWVGMFAHFFQREKLTVFF